VTLLKLSVVAVLIALCADAYGILIVTQVAKDASSEDLAMLDLFWKSLRITIK
jgi:hypothetical protein